MRKWPSGLTYRRLAWNELYGILELSVAMIQCIRSSGWTGYMLMEVRHDLPEVGFVKVPCDDRGSVRVFVDVAAELFVEFGQSQARVCLLI